MADNIDDLGLGIIVSLEDLRNILTALTTNEHRWEARVPVAEGEPSVASNLSIDIWYSNPGLVDMPNAICFRFPALRPRTIGPGDTFICLHPSLVEPVLEGLYFEGDQLKADFMEDYRRFWVPLRTALSPTVRS